MSNAVGELIQDIAYRIGEAKMNEPFTHAVILRAMRRVYQQLNEELKPIEKELSIDFSDDPLDGDLDEGYYNLPSDCIAVSKIPDYRYVPYQAWKSSETKTFTVYLNRIYFSNVSSSLSLTIAYISAGYTLVDQDSGLASTEINEPEYPDYSKRCHFPQQDSPS